MYRVVVKVHIVINYITKWDASLIHFHTTEQHISTNLDAKYVG
jgi:hypothetical protein